MGILKDVQSFNGCNQYKNFNVTYYADLQDNKAQLLNTKNLSFGIKGFRLK